MHLVVLTYRWSLIASHLPGRTDNEIKNYWNSHLSRQFHGFRWTDTASNDTAITIDINKLSAARKQRGARALGQSPSSSMKKQPVLDPTKAQDRYSPIGATSSASSLPLRDPDHNQPINNISVSHTSSESYSEDWIWPMLKHPVDQNGGVVEPNSALDRTVVWEADNSMKQIEIWEDENDMEALLSSIDMPASGLTGIVHGGQFRLEDLLDHYQNLGLRRRPRPSA